MSETNVAIRRSLDPGFEYPTATYAFSPDERFPEYRFNDISPIPNHVYRMVRDLLFDLGLDRTNFGTPRWNPLGDWVRRGQKVFCLVNFVTHRRPDQRARDFLGMLTHPSVIRPVLDYLIIATGDPALVSFGNAPVQSALIDSIIADTGAASLRDFYKKELGHDLGPRDLRLYVTRVNWLGYVSSVVESEGDDEVALDLGGDSLLEMLPEQSFSSFRVEDYGSSATGSFHSKARHVYLVNRKVLEADIIFHVPKLKTHSKVGITCALKGAVGAIGRKECLAHHRKGWPEEGGDELHQGSALARLYCYLGEKTQMNGGLGNNLLRVAYKSLGRVLDRILRVDVRGSWYGNDTAWRMALDINRCLLYGRTDGTLSDTPLRRICALTDGIHAGEGDGPIHVSGRKDALLILSEQACFADLGAALVMGFDPSRIPLIREAFSDMKYPLTHGRPQDAAFLFNGRLRCPDEISRQVAAPFLAPRGWRGHVEVSESGASEMVEP